MSDTITMPRPVRKVSLRDVGRFEAFVVEKARRIYVNVFLCGKAFDNTLPKAELVKNDIRAYLNERLKTSNDNCRVFFGEHSDLVKQYSDAIGRVTGRSTLNVNLAAFELQLAKFVDLIVIFPSSAGSFAELGMFITQEDLGNKLFLVQEPSHRSAKSFIAKGPVDLAQKRSATIVYLAYSDMDAVYRAVQKKVAALHELKLFDGLIGDQ